MWVSKPCVCFCNSSRNHFFSESSGLENLVSIGFDIDQTQFIRNLWNNCNWVYHGIMYLVGWSSWLCGRLVANVFWKWSSPHSAYTVSTKRLARYYLMYIQNLKAPKAQSIQFTCLSNRTDGFSILKVSKSVMIAHRASAGSESSGGIII